jgi:Fe-S cluster biosynthesis and repair protein YggX
MDINERIAQFRNMAEADPTNEMAHFSLANALLQAERYDEAATAFGRCIELRPDMSKAYQLAGQALSKSNKRDAAVAILTKGFEVASERGDRMPRDGIAELLKSLDAPVPEVAVKAKTAASTDGGFVCQRTGRPGTQLPKPPFRGPLGQRIYETISAQTWSDWLGQGTKVINEFRLDLSREDHARIYDQHMLEFLGLEEFADAEQA